MRTLSLCLALAGGLFSQDQPLPDGASLDIVVREVLGEVDVRTVPKEKWVPLTPGMKLPVGSKICTGVESGAVLGFGTNSVAIVSAVTTCEIRGFAMQADRLVAQIHIDPGIAKVSVRQLPQFFTDFQVSTPRLTCSVRGSEIVVEANTGNGDMNDAAACTDHEAFATDQTGDEHDLDEDEETNSDGESNLEIETVNNIVDVLDGESEQEGEDESLAANNAGGIDLNLSDTTVDTDPSPSGGDGGVEDFGAEEGVPGGIQQAVDFLAAHGYGELLDFLRDGPDATGELMRAAQDQWDDVNFNQNTDPVYVEKHDAIHLLDGFFAFGGILHDHHGLDYPQEHDLLHAFIEENHAEDHAFAGLGGGVDGDQAAWHELAHEEGLRTTVDQAVADMEASFVERLDANPDLQQGPREWRDARQNDFHDGPVGVDAMLADLHALSDQAASGGGFDNDLYGKTLIQMFHARVHELLVGLPPGNSPGAYDYEHQDVHDFAIADLLDTLAQDGVHAMIEEKAALLHEAWHNDTGIPEEVQPGQTGYDEHEALHDALDEFQDKAGYAADHAAD